MRPRPQAPSAPRPRLLGRQFFSPTLLDALLVPLCSVSDQSPKFVAVQLFSMGCSGGGVYSDCHRP